MASYTRRTTTITRNEWVIPCTPGLGAPIGEFSRAYKAACRAWQDAHGPGVEMCDDSLWVTQGDEEIIISFESRSGVDAA